MAILAFLVLICVSRGLLLHVTEAEAIHCAIHCVCAPDRKTTAGVFMECYEKHTIHSTLPRLPRNATFVYIKQNDMPTLHRNLHGNIGERTLQTLIMLGNNISFIDPDTFHGLTQLRALSIRGDKLKSLLPGTFTNNKMLRYLRLDENQFSRIPSENICLLRSLQHLNMASNKLRTAKLDGCFSHLKNLNTLEISKNPIDQIQPGDFDALRNASLSALYLEGLGLKALSAKVLVPLRHLTVLSLRNNSLVILDTDLFKPTPHIATLFLERNRINEFSALLALTSLETLNLGNNDFRSNTVTETFQSLQKLKNLDLSHNSFGSLHNDSFANLHSNKLTQLSLDNCSLRSIEAGTFASLHSLQELSLQGNDIGAAALEQGFYGLFSSELEKLFLDHNNLRDLNCNTFRNLENSSVVQLSATNCHITMIPTDAFKYLPHLEDLYLQNNRITELHHNAFKYNTHLTHVDLSYNGLDAVPEANSTKLGNVKTLSLRKNAVGDLGKLTKSSFLGYVKLEKLDLLGNSIMSLEDEVFIGARNLQTLDVSHNNLGFISKDAFKGLHKLESLYLRYNNIYVIGADTFVPLSQLKILDLSYNVHLGYRADMISLLKPLTSIQVLELITVGLQSLPKELFRNLTEIKALTMSDNEINRIDHKTLRDQVKLEVLTINRNKIQTISKDLVTHPPHLKKFQVADNPFRCDCKLLWFANWIREGTVYLRDLHYATCKTPLKKSGTMLTDLFLERECMSLTFYYAYSSGILAFVFTVTLATVIFRLRWYIRYWRHLVRARKAMEREMGEERYVFDAFVSYTYQDQKWVVRELLPELEYKSKMRLCLHQRNWLAGRAITRNIVDSIEKSRKTVLILSNNYARSKWCDFELSMALNKVLSKRSDVVVPILLENIKTCYVTEQLVHLFATQTYIKWPQRNERKQRRFWRKLVKTLRPPQEQAEYDEDARDFLTNEINRIRPGYRRIH